mmetsp:Transcript_32904/g.68765  ORF Transcript_32904/g.68765 Transcript_32904/m.68765 type:complete len:85 (+) Transcript_32904:321-575(+)
MAGCVVDCRVLTWTEQRSGVIGRSEDRVQPTRRIYVFKRHPFVIVTVDRDARESGGHASDDGLGRNLATDHKYWRCTLACLVLA